MTAEFLTPEFFAPVVLYLILLTLITYYTVSAASRSASGLSSANAALDDTSGTADQNYFLAGRGVSSGLAFVSVVATETSVATILVFPQVGFKGGFALIWLCLGYIAGRWLVARVYLEPIYRLHRLSMYATVTGSVPARRMLSLAYLVAKYISSGVRFFMGGVAFAALLGWELAPAILFIAAIAGMYSLAGGLRAVILTDQLQGYIILFMGLFLVVSLFTQLDLSTVAAPAWINLDAALTNAQFFPVLFLGGAVLSIGTHGADQDMLQRVLATPSIEAARRALILSGIGATVVITMYLAVGVLLSAGVASGQIEGVAKNTPLVDYINVLKNPWLAGSFAVLIVAAAMSTLDSALHSTGAVWKSILQRGDSENQVAAGSEAVQANRGGTRIYSFLSLLILTMAALGFAGVSGYRDFLDLAMSFMNYVNGGLIGIFSLFVLNKRPLGFSAIAAALITGFAVTLLANTGFDARPGWTYTTIVSAGLALVAAWVAQRLS